MKEPLRTELWRALCDRSLWKQVRNRFLFALSAVVFGVIVGELLSMLVLKIIGL